MPLTPRARAVAALLLLLATLPAAPTRAQQTRDPGATPAIEAPALRATLAEPLQWRDLLAGGARKLHTDVFPSIDLAFSGNRNLVSLHFVARPGADLGALAFDLAGTEQLALDRAVTAYDPARHERIRLALPEAFQMVAGAMDTVEARYVRRTDGRFAIELGDHAPSLPVVITVTAGYVAAPDARAAAPASPEAAGPLVRAPMTDQVIPDSDNDGKANPGETIRYTTEIRNDGPSDATGVKLDDTIDPNTTLTAGTVKTTPLAYAQTVPTLEDNAVTVHLTGNDPDGGSLTFTIDTGPTIGSLGTITPTGATTADVTYTPNANVNGSDSFVFKVTDTDANTDVATVSINIMPVNDAPTFACGADQIHLVGDGPVISVAGWATGISAGPADESGQTLTFHVTANTDPGLFSVAPAVDPATGNLTYTLAGTTGSSDITLTLQDDGGTASGGVDTSTPCSFKVTVNGPPTASNDGPAGTSAPGDAFHTALNTTLNSATDAATPTLLSNDDLGFPAGTLVSFGGGDLGGAVTDNAAGATLAVGGSGSLTVNADGEFVFTPDTGFIGLFTFQYRLENSAGHSDATVTLAVGVRPDAVADGLKATGNVRVDAGTIPFSVLTNDAGDGISVTGMDATSANGGNVVNSGSGAFTYNPPPGFDGDDTFGYTITNGFGNATGTVTMHVSDMIWFIDNAAASAGDGRRTSPFQTLAAFDAVNGNGGPNDPDVGEPIFIAQGSGSYTGGVHLIYNQVLIGDGSSSNLAAITGITLAPGSDPLPVFTGTDPVIENASGNAITLGHTTTVRGLTAGNAPTGFSIGGGGGSITIQQVSVIGTGGALGITASGTDGTLQFDQLSSTAAPAQAILLTGFSGTITVTAGSITDPLGTAVEVSGGSPTLTYPGAITKNNAGRVVDVDGTTDGTLTFNGVITQNNAGGTGIRVANVSSPASVTFKGLSVANNGGGISFQNNTGPVNVTGSANTISTTGAVAVDILNSSIGASGIMLQSVSATNATRGIRLDNTGSAGFFTVTGTGTTGGSGGSIAGSTTEGITLNNTGAVTIKNLNVTGTASGTNAVGATTVDGLTFDNCELNAAAGAGGGTTHALLGNTVTALTATNSVFDGGGGSVPTVNAVDLTDLFGNSSFSGSTFRNGKDINVSVHNSILGGGPCLLDIVNGTTFSNSGGGDHLNVLADGTSNLTVSVSNGGGSDVTFSGTSQDGMEFLTRGLGHLEADVTQATISGNLGSAINMAAETSATLTATVQNLTGLSSGATNVINMIGYQGSTITASILNNTIDLGAGSYTGIRAIQEGNGTVTASISGNTISGPGNEWGIRGHARAGTGHLNLNVNNNNVTLTNSIALEGIAIESGSSAGTDQNSICLNMAGNSSSTAGGGLTAYRLRVRSATTAFDLQDFAGSGISTSDVASWVSADKGNSGSTLVTIGAGASFAASAGNCATP